MAKFSLPQHGSTIRLSGDPLYEQKPLQSVDADPLRGEENSGPSVFTMWAYFLGLASIAMIVVGGHFPWFTLAPAIVLLMVGHFRRIEAKYRRKSSSRLAKT